MPRKVPARLDPDPVLGDVLYYLGDAVLVLGRITNDFEYSDFTIGEQADVNFGAGRLLVSFLTRDYAGDGHIGYVDALRDDNVTREKEDV